MEYFTLQSGIKLPAIGIGTNTFGKEGGVWGGAYNGDFSPVESALKAGYRFFDSAIMYVNDGGLGEALEHCGIPRSELTVLSKFLYRQDIKPSIKDVRRELIECMRRLRTEYLDVFLIHEPWDDIEHMAEVWKVLEEFYIEGKFRAIGVSNFNVEELESLMEHVEIRPAVNEIPSNGQTLNHETVSWCQENGILPIAWGPLSDFKPHQKKLFGEIGEKYGKSWAQTILRYQIQRGVCVIPKSHDSVRQASNIDIFDFHLQEEDMRNIALSV